MLRNRIIGSVFFRLHLIERFGTGVRRIKEEYMDSKIKPVFDMTENTIKITRPVKEKGSSLTEDENTTSGFSGVGGAAPRRLRRADSFAGGEPGNHTRNGGNDNAAAEDR